jgi:hypothetical protein
MQRKRGERIKSSVIMNTNQSDEFIFLTLKIADTYHSHHKFKRSSSLDHELIHLIDVSSMIVNFIAASYDSISTILSLESHHSFALLTAILL